MSDASRDLEQVVAFYERGLERDRLATGAGALEFARTQTLIERYLPPAPATIAGIGGGPGRYAIWLTQRGYRVHLVDAVSLHVEQACLAASALPGVAFASAEVGDARELKLPDASADAVLVLGPLYHLTERADRVRVLVEARRVCRPGGIIVAAAISHFASTLDGLREGYLLDPKFAAVAEADRRDGRHRNPTGDPKYFTTAYFHHPAELANECEAAGLTHKLTAAVEGPAWFLPDLEVWLADGHRRTVLLDALAALEVEPTLLGMSAHFLAIAHRT